MRDAGCSSMQHAAAEQRLGTVARALTCWLHVTRDHVTLTSEDVQRDDDECVTHSSLPAHRDYNNRLAGLGRGFRLALTHSALGFAL